MLDAHMLAKVLRRTGERVELGWSQFDPERLHGDRTETGCILQQLAAAYRDVTGQPVGQHFRDHHALLMALEVAAGIARPFDVLEGFTLWNDAPERTVEDVASACYRAAVQVEAQA